MMVCLSLQPQKNDEVWNKIKTEIGCYSLHQVKDRWQYLRRRYIAKKDNMSAKSSGAATMKFDYFDEIDDILRKKPNVTPLAVASSSRGSEGMLPTIHQCHNYKSQTTSIPSLFLRSFLNFVNNLKWHLQ